MAEESPVEVQTEQSVKHQIKALQHQIKVRHGDKVGHMSGTIPCDTLQEGSYQGMNHNRSLNKIVMAEICLLMVLKATDIFTPDWRKAKL